jgi:predicted acyl esterase
MRLIFVVLLVLLISACSVNPDVKMTSGPQAADTDEGSARPEETETPETQMVIAKTATTGEGDGEDITLTTSDGVQLAARFYAPENLNADTAVLILVHEAYRDSSSWDGFHTAALENGYAVIALDLRGHGQSEGDLVFDEAMDRDIDAVMEWIRTTPDLNGDRIIIAGASVGANLALRAGARYPQINTLVLLSPGLMYWEIGTENAILDYGRRPLLLVASENDAYSATSVRKLNELGRGYDKLVIYPGAEHGTEMIRSQPDLSDLIFNWFEQTME